MGGGVFKVSKIMGVACISDDMVGFVEEDIILDRIWLASNWFHHAAVMFLLL